MKFAVLTELHVLRYKYVYAKTHIHLCMYVCVYVSVCMKIYAQTYIYAGVCVCIHIYTCSVYIWICIYICIYIYICTFIYTRRDTVVSTGLRVYHTGLCGYNTRDARNLDMTISKLTLF